MAYDLRGVFGFDRMLQGYETQFEVNLVVDTVDTVEKAEEIRQCRIAGLSMQNARDPGGMSKVCRLVSGRCFRKIGDQPGKTDGVVTRERKRAL
ncbi:hypothetical protein D3C87_1812870 [compost metagenome]